MINPLQSDALRNLYIRQTKTDTQDAFLIAEVLRFGQCRPTTLADETLIALRQLSRFRFHLVDTLADAKRRALALLDQVFPEYDQYFSDVFGKASSALLHTYATPDEIAATDVHALADLLLTASRQRVGFETARAIHEAAQDSFGITQALDVYRMQLRMLLDQIAFLEDQIAELEADIRRRVDSLDHHLVTIPGIGPVLAAAILGEIGDITRFASAQRLVAFAGIDPTVSNPVSIRRAGRGCPNADPRTYDGLCGWRRTPLEPATPVSAHSTNVNARRASMLCAPQARWPAS